MPASTLLALVDDIATLLDDVAVLTKVAIKKTSGVVGDDLALNAEQVSGFSVDRELPVVWAVAKGSFLNKLVLVPAALLISAFAPQLIMPLLMIGGTYLCYEGFEKVAHKFLPLKEKKEDTEHRAAHSSALTDPAIDLVALERTRIKGAIRTDFILSAEIIVISLGTVAAAPMAQQIIALSVIAIGITVLVYGLVAGIVKLDDLGLQLHGITGTDRTAVASRRFGGWILRAAPILMRTLGIVGTAAMFLVGGSILVHGLPAVEHLVGAATSAAGAQAGLLGTLVRLVLDGTAGIVAGGVVVALVAALSAVRRAFKSRRVSPS